MANEIKMVIKVGQEDYIIYSKLYFAKILKSPFISKENVDLYVNNQKINFPEDSSLGFSKEGEYNITLKFKCFMKNCSALFSECQNIIHIDFTEFNPREIIDMSKIFYNCVNLKSVNFSNFNSSKLTNMSQMFYGCSNLDNINFYSFNAINVTNMTEMFSHCGIKYIKFSFLNSINLKSMREMFSFCQNLRNVDFGSFETKNVIDMSYLFQGCKNLDNIDFSKLKTQNVETMEGMFFETNLININNFSNLKTDKVKNFSYFFSRCSNLNNNHLSSLTTKNADNMSHFFEGCDLNGISFSSIDTQKLVNMDYFFAKCKNIEINQNSSLLNLKKCLSMSHTFYNTDLLKVNFSFLDSQNVENMQYCFAECKNIKINENSVLNARNCLNSNYMFYNNDLNNVNFSFVDLRNTENMNYCFAECKNIKINESSVLNAKNCLNSSYMFYKNDLNNVNFSFVDLRNTENMNYCFAECKNIIINDKSILKLKNCIKMDYAFYKIDLNKVNFSFLDIRNVESMQYCFAECKNIKINDKSILKLKSCINMDYAFYKNDLYNVDFSFLQAFNVESMQYCFAECENIKINENSVLNVKNCLNSNYMFYKNDLNNVNFSFVDLSHTESMKYCFAECKNIKINENSALNTKKCKNCDYMFYKSDFSDPNFTFLDISNAESMKYCFAQCKNMKINDKSVLNISNCIIMDHAFEKVDLNNVLFSYLKINNVKSMSYCFSECQNIKINEQSILDTKYLIEMSYLFQNCDIKNINFSYVSTDNILYMTGLLYGCKNIANNHLSSLNTKNVIIMDSFFANCDLTNINISLLKTKNVKYMKGMFFSCNLTNVDFSSFDTSNVVDMERMFGGCKSSTIIDLSHLDTHNVKNMRGMFQYCELTNIDISSFDVINVEDISEMFNQCSNLISLALPPFKRKRSISMNDLFRNCHSLRELKIWAIANENYNNIIVAKRDYPNIKVTILRENEENNNNFNQNFQPAFNNNFNMNNQINMNFNNGFNLLNNYMNYNINMNNMINNMYLDNNFNIFNNDRNNYNNLPFNGMNNNNYNQNNMSLNFNNFQNMNYINNNPLIFNNNFMNQNN